MTIKSHILLQRVIVKCKKLFYWKLKSKNMIKSMYQSKKSESILPVTGLVILLLGLLILFGLCFCSIFQIKTIFIGENEGIEAAISFLFIMIGLTLLLPDMLKAPDKSGYSSMRIIVFMISSTFCFLGIKIGWNAKGFTDFSVGSGWSLILSAALGSKAIQSLGETRNLMKSPTDTNKANPLATGRTDSQLDIFDPSSISLTPPTSPPVHIKAR